MFAEADDFAVFHLGERSKRGGLVHAEGEVGEDDERLGFFERKAVFLGESFKFVLRESRHDGLVRDVLFVNFDKAVVKAGIYRVFLARRLRHVRLENERCHHRKKEDENGKPQECSHGVFHIVIL